MKQATPYAWYIISRSNSTSDTTHSATWKFYNAGAGQTDFAPFPATLLLPAYGAMVTAGQVTLSWSGEAVQNNISGYDVYISSNPTPAVYQSGINATQLTLTVTSGTTYYWQVVTHDLNNNASVSQVWEFNVQ